MQVISKKAMGFHSVSTPGGVAFVQGSHLPQYLPEDVRSSEAFEGAKSCGVIREWNPPGKPASMPDPSVGVPVKIEPQRRTRAKE